MKRMALMLSALALVLLLIGCEKKPKSLSIPDITLEVGEKKEIPIQVEPKDAVFDITFEFEGTNISIVGREVKGIVGGTETVVTARTSNGLTTTFKVIVKPKDIEEEPEEPDVPGTNLLVNASFESGHLEPWVSTDRNYGLEWRASDAYDGEYSFKLWYDADGDGTSEAFNVSLYQKVTLDAGRYVFTVWLNTGIQETTLWAKADLEGEAFEYRTIPGATKGYKQYGIEFVIEEKQDVYVGATFIGNEGAWGFADGFALVKDGTLPEMDEEDDVKDNLLLNPGFEDSNSEAVHWTIVNESNGVVEINPNESNSYSGYHNLSMYNLTSGEIRIYQRVDTTNVQRVHLSVRIIGEDMAIDTFYLYLKDGERLHTQNIRTAGWNAGYLVFLIDDLAIENNEVEVGIYFKQTDALAGNYWANIDHFILEALS